ncbi:AraC family transcriptional regulator [Alkalihalobacillus trypoxylicola]|uniref:AraC family transcriptional regulator n=1 Tax=Alkalihalobacillus trypoxylicola TaxID=519424 RepID=A0A161PKD8_9BACI|nr:AraC family transcriptional regulator [Alkalihalobacillus trypoxylicola]KYG34370.1 AraC family transcriptional regulator [Alkalihalobacillus trypoxylicola]
MSIDLYKELIKLTEEEKEIISSNKKIIKERYTDQVEFIIESGKFLHPDKMIVARKHTRFIDFPKHRHNYIEVNYVYHGSLRQRVGNKDIHLKQGELLFLNQHIEHELHACQKEDLIINFIIQPEFFEFMFSFFSSENMMSHFFINSLLGDSRNGQALYFQVSDVKSIQELMEKLMLEIFVPSFMTETTLKLNIGLLLVELVKNIDRLADSHEQSQQQNVMVEIMHYIQNHYQTGSLFELSEQLNQPHYRLSKFIKNMTGKTFKEILQDKRLSQAKNLLITSDVSISSIAEKIGYENISYFYRIFKEKYQDTPKQFRQKYWRK